MIKRISLLLLIATLPLISLGQKRSILLELKKGETYKSLIIGTMSIHQTIDDFDNTHELQYSGKMLFHVEDIDNDQYTLSAMYTSFAINVNMGIDNPFNLTFSSDSTSDMKDVVRRLTNNTLKRMTNNNFTVILNKNGTIEKIIGYKELTSRAFDSTFSTFDQLDSQSKSELKVLISGYLDKTFSDDAIKKSFESFFDIYTNKAVAVNDQWSNNAPITDSSKLDNKTTYTLKEQNKDYLLISGTRVIVIDSEEEYSDVGTAYVVKSDMKGDEVSTFKVDPVSGWIIEAKISSEIYGQIHMTSNDQPSSNKTVPSSIISTFTISNK